VARIIHDFAPDAVITFGPDGGYGHPDHVAISAATTRAWSSLASDARRPALFYSHFPQRNLLLSRQFADWLVGQRERFQASPEFAHGLTLLAESASVLGFARDKPRTQWFPAGFSMVEQDERSADLYLILSGTAAVIREEEDGTRRVLRRLGAGEFFGELAVAHGRPRSASVVATEPVTCLVLATETPTAFAGRGAQARLTKAVGLVVGDVEQSADALFGIDVANHLDQKLAAMAAHQTQYPVRPELYPSTLLRAVFGRESFVAVSAPARRATAA
jgi:LmbE family N-acetylglucosaminyl deacetylase